MSDCISLEEWYEKHLLIGDSLKYLASKTYLGEYLVNLDTSDCPVAARIIDEVPYGPLIDDMRDWTEY